MNLLNSVIVEGVISSAIDAKNVFELTYTRQTTVGTVQVTSETAIKCFVSESMCKSIKKGRAVRIVGRLSNIGDNLGVFVEHIEFKPEIIKEGKYTFQKN